MLSEEMSLGEMLETRDKIGSKQFNKIISSKPDTERPPLPDFKRAHKKRPREASSKRKVSVIRNPEQIAKKNHRDPRFDDLSGEFDESRFEASYDFLKEMRTDEKQQLNNELKKCKDEQRKVKIVSLINKMNTSEKASALSKQRQDIKVQSRKAAMANVEKGKNPYFMKKKDMRKSELKQKFDKLKQDGQVDKYMAKRRKKNYQKDKKSL